MDAICRQIFGVVSLPSDDFCPAWSEEFKKKRQQWTTSQAGKDLSLLGLHCIALFEHACDTGYRSTWVAMHLYWWTLTCWSLLPSNPEYMRRTRQAYRMVLQVLPEDSLSITAAVKIDYALKMLEALVSRGSKSYPEIDAILDEACNAWLTRAKIRSSRGDLDICIDVIQKALFHVYSILGQSKNVDPRVCISDPQELKLEAQRTDEPCQQCLRAYKTIAHRSWSMYQVSGTVQFLEEALYFCKICMSAEWTRVNTRWLVQVSSLLIELGKASQSYEEIETSIRMLQKLETSILATSSIELLGSVYITWSKGLEAKEELTEERKQQMQYIESAIEVAGKAMELPSAVELDSDRWALVHQLFRLFSRKFHFTRAIEDAAKATKYAHMCATLSDIDDVQRSTNAGQHGALLEQMWSASKDLKYLDESINKYQECYDLARHHMPSSKYLSFALLLRHIANKTPADLDRALCLIDFALANPTALLDQMANLMFTAGIAHKYKYLSLEEDATRTTEARTHLHQAIDYFTQSAQSQYNATLSRVSAARQGAKLLASILSWKTAHALLHDALELSSTIMTMNMKFADQRRILERLSGLAAEACSTAIKCGNIECAIEDLERGRSMIVAATHKASHDLERLASLQPSLFKEYCQIRDQLIETWHGKPDHAADRDLPQRISLLNTKMQQVLSKINAEPEFKQFLRPIKLQEMQRLCGNDVVIVINTSCYGDDALLVQGHRIRSIPLISETFMLRSLKRATEVMEALVHPASQYTQQLMKTASGVQGMLRGLLAILWRHIGKPVVEELGWQPLEPSSDRFKVMLSRRILWLPTGLYSRLPIHAAMSFVNKGDNLLVGRGVVSSYISSFRMLRFSQEISSSASINAFRGSFLSMERPAESNGRQYIPRAAQEVMEVIQKASSIAWTTLRRPTKAEALKQFRQCSWLHIISHGISDVNDPSASYLRLEQESAMRSSDNNPTSGNLEVQEISNGGGAKGIGAFLSACSTAEIRAPKLLDENLTICFAMQIAGFAHVIGHLWPATGFVTPLLARYFYQSLEELGAIKDGIVRNDLIALCVSHAAVCTILEKDCVMEPIFWAGFIHIGP